MPVCGDFGGTTADGSPCGRAVEDGLCFQHKPKGRPPFEPDDQTREFVKLCVMGGIPQEDIAGVIGITDKTLRKHFRYELDTAYERANAKVVNTAFQMATDGKNASMTMFWLKTRMGWKETQRHEHTGADGERLQGSTIVIRSQGKDPNVE